MLSGIVQGCELDTGQISKGEARCTRFGKERSPFCYVPVHYKHPAKYCAESRIPTAFALSETEDRDSFAVGTTNAMQS